MVMKRVITYATFDLLYYGHINLPCTPEISSSWIRKDLYDANTVDVENKISYAEVNTYSGLRRDRKVNENHSFSAVVQEVAA